MQPTQGSNPFSSLAPSARSIVRAKQFSAFFGISRAKLYELQDPRSPRFDPTFPRPVRLGVSPRGAVGWWANEIEAWLESRRCR